MLFYRKNVISNNHVFSAKIKKFVFNKIFYLKLFCVYKIYSKLNK